MTRDCQFPSAIKEKPNKQMPILKIKLTTNHRAGRPDVSPLKITHHKLKKNRLPSANPNNRVIHNSAGEESISDKALIMIFLIAWWIEVLVINIVHRFVLFGQPIPGGETT